ncbi:hypothetical protein FRC10_008911 [Ceratobasidium sp. 414]|nr:hypothetical protein FRC10_008911 [Ceratobasidium sp. 414]
MAVQGPGTVRWMTPEAQHRHLNGEEPERPNSSTDVWSWGHLVYETVTGNIPYPQCRNDLIAAQAIIGGEINPRPTEAFLTARFWPVLEKCWSMEPKKRPRIVDIVRGPRLATFSWSSKVSVLTEGGVYPNRCVDDPLSLRQDPTTYGSAREYMEQGEDAFRREAYEEAIDYYDQARQSFERVGDRGQTGSCLRDLRWAYMRLRKHESARVYFIDALELCRTLGDLKMELEAILDLAAAERLAGNFTRSREYLTYAYNTCMSAHLYIRVGWCLNAMGVLHVDEQNWEAAHECFNKSAEVAQQHSSQGLLGRSSERQGDCCMLQKTLVKQGDVTILLPVPTEVSPEKQTRRIE